MVSVSLLGYRKTGIAIAVVGVLAALGFFVSAVGAAILGASGLAAVILWQRTFLEEPIAGSIDGSVITREGLSA
jgi:hypothetical protein